MWFECEQLFFGVEHYVTRQARIHTGFHRFMEIGQIFHNKYIFNNKNTFQVETWAICYLSDSKTQERGLKELNTKTFLGKPAPQTPLDSACAFGPRLGNRSVFIPDPRLQDMPKNSCEGAETSSEWAKRILINNSLEMMNKKIIISKSGTVGWRIKWKKIILVIDAMYFCSCKKTAKKFRLRYTYRIQTLDLCIKLRCSALPNEPTSQQLGAGHWVGSLLTLQAPTWYSSNLLSVFRVLTPSL